MGFYGGIRFNKRGPKLYGGYHTSGCCLLPFVVIILIAVGVLCLMF